MSDVNHELPLTTTILTVIQWHLPCHISLSGLPDLTGFAGVNLTNVNTINIGVGNKSSPIAGDAGTMYFEDIRLVR